MPVLAKDDGIVAINIAILLTVLYFLCIFLLAAQLGSEATSTGCLVPVNCGSGYDK